MAEHYDGTPSATSGDELKRFAQTQILNEDKVREDGILKEFGLPRTIPAKERFANAIAAHSKLSQEQKEHALYFLFSPTYPIGGHAIARNYIRLCLNPNYSTRGTAWRGKAPTQSI